MWDNAPWRPRAWQREALPLAIASLKSGKKPVISAIMGAGKSVLIAELVYQALKKLHPDYKIVIVAPRQNLIRQLSKTIAVRCGADNVGCYYTHAKELDRPIIVTTFVSAPVIARKIKVSLLVGDEVHGTEAANFKGSYEFLNPACAIGFTATPYRSDENETLSLWDEVIYRYTAGNALQDKVIVPWQLVHWDGKGSSNTDVICMNLIKQQKGLGVVSALNIDDAVAYSKYLNDNGVPALPIHSKMTQIERENTLADFALGRVKCLVHVSLLSEGVDMPFLKWMCLRRPVGSRVRFVQEVGRVLRCNKGKDKAYIIDPHDLFGKHSLANPERLGEVLTKEEKEYEEQLCKLEPNTDTQEVIRKMPKAVAFGHVDSYVASFLSIMRASGIASPPGDWEEDSWRGGSPTTKQLDTVVKMKWASKYLPENIRTPYKMIIDNAPHLNKGTVADILSVLFGLARASKLHRKQHRHWHIPKIKYPKPEFPIQQMLFVMEHN
ncbi:MAG: hypothetical protein CMC15_17645 [Flavobacteriaceae bacterium]|nr:hypothetical protein [Flavobacteriaceae bacterium]